MPCQKCKSERVCSVGGKCSDTFSAGIGTAEIQGYVPDDLGVGSGDYIDFNFCMDCGQLQGKFPLPPADMEREISDSEVLEFFENHFLPGERIESRIERQVKLVDSAKHESVKFAAYLTDFLVYNQNNKYPSAEVFLKAFRSNSTDIP